MQHFPGENTAFLETLISVTLASHSSSSLEDKLLRSFSTIQRFSILAPNSGTQLHSRQWRTGFMELLKKVNAIKLIGSVKARQNERGDSSVLNSCGNTT